MCDELKEHEYMQAYVQEYGNAFPCSLATPELCDEKETQYLLKMQASTEENRLKQLARLEGMADSDMTAELRSWLKKRTNILRQLTADANMDKDEL